MMTGSLSGSQGGRASPGGDPEVIRVLRPSDGSLVGELAVTPVYEIPQRVARTRSVQVHGGHQPRAPEDGDVPTPAQPREPVSRTHAIPFPIFGGPPSHMNR